VADDRTTVSIVEDHPMFRMALRTVVESDSALALGTVADGVPRFRADAPPPGGVVLLDLSLPGVSGTEAVQEISRDGHRVLMVSASERPEHLLASLDAGACGYLSKTADAEQLLWGIHRVAEGQLYVAPHLASRLLAERHRRRPAAAVHELTEREREVLALVAEGHTDREVAARLRIAVRTVRSHLDHIRTKTGRRRRTELTRLAVDEGVVEG
jgi:DNA-binding NarL/FixJ family response regulator